jgi:hypothetical protein
VFLGEKRLSGAELLWSLLCQTLNQKDGFSRLSFKCKKRFLP